LLLTMGLTRLELQIEAPWRYFRGLLSFYRLPTTNAVGQVHAASSIQRIEWAGCLQLENFYVMSEYFQKIYCGLLTAICGRIKFKSSIEWTISRGIYCCSLKTIGENGFPFPSKMLCLIYGNIYFRIISAFPFANFQMNKQ